MRQGLAAFEATGAGLLRPYFLALLAEAHSTLGQAGEGLAVLSQAQAAIDKNGERLYEAEVWRLKGELTLKSEERRAKSEERNSRSSILDPLSRPEACFLKAIAIARQQSAKSLELRAVVSLSRLWQQQGKKKEARKLLAEIYGWFIEGFATADLQEAQALLKELS